MQNLTENTTEKIKQLTEQLNTYRNAYYNHNKSIVTDREYDLLFDQLKQLETQANYALANSPTQSVGFSVKSKLEKVTHPIPLLSLDKTKNISDLVKFAANQECLLMMKYDGLTVELIYENGQLTQASTRGDGKTGENITHNALTFKNIPQKISYKNHLRIVGEAIILADDFKQINDSLCGSEKPYANQRNLASGSVRQLDSSICAQRNVRWMLWDVLEGLDEVCVYNTRSAKFDYLRTIGFEKPTFFFHFNIADTSILEEKINSLKQTAKAQQIPIDGLVMKYNDIAYSKQQGSTSHHNNDGIAFKFDDEIAETTLRAIEWSMGKTGQLTPIAVFDPVELEGTTVSRASMHNFSIMEDLLSHQPYVGQKISVYKANMIIPQVFNADRSAPPENAEYISTPQACPICGKPTQLSINNDTKTLICANKNCQGKLLGKFSHFVSKQAMNIIGLSDSIIERFLEQGWLNTYSDFYKLHEHKTEIINMNGFGLRSYEKLIQAIEASRRTTLDRVLNAVDIPNIGTAAAKQITNHCQNSPEKFLELAADNYDWTILPDFGTILANSIHDYFASTENMNNFTDLLSYLRFPKQKSAKITDNPFAGKTVAVTGSLTNFTRDTIHQKLEELGAKVTNSVSKKTDYLIAGDKAGSKLSKAEKLNVTILTEAQFIAMLNQK